MTKFTTTNKLKSSTLLSQASLWIVHPNSAVQSPFTMSKGAAVQPSWHEATPHSGSTGRLNSAHLTDPVLLTYLQHRAVVKVVGTGAPLQRGEGHVAPGERGDVAELVGAERLLLILAGADEAAVDFAVGALAGAAVVLVGHPGAVLPRALVDGKALGPAGVELEAHVRDVKGFSWGGQETPVRKTQN